MLFHFHRPFLFLPLFVSLGALAGMSQTKELPQSASVKPLTARFEHLAFNVSDPQAIVRWYTKYLGMKVVRADGPPAYLSFIADSGMNVMLEFQHQQKNPVFEPSSIHHMAMHLAFVTPNINQSQQALLRGGATIAESLKVLASGDRVVTLRDPWGFALQLVERVIPMLQRQGMYPEHLAVNTTDSRARSMWYRNNLGFVVIRDATAALFAVFSSDAGEHLMFELYQFPQYPFVDLQKLNPFSMHVAFATNDVANAKECLAKGGASFVEFHNTVQGDSVLVLRDPWGMPIHIVKRVKPMLQ